MCHCQQLFASIVITLIASRSWVQQKMTRACCGRVVWIEQTNTFRRFVAFCMIQNYAIFLTVYNNITLSLLPKCNEPQKFHVIAHNIMRQWQNSVEEFDISKNEKREHFTHYKWGNGSCYCNDALPSNSQSKSSYRADVISITRAVLKSSLVAAQTPFCKEPYPYCLNLW